jgi:hypothetical protein
MIPAFNQHGCLPYGVHPATLDEIDARFGQLSELRRVQMESVRWMVDLAVRVGAERIVLNGSFVTDIMEPNDVDCVLLVGPGYPVDPVAEEELEDGLPFLDIAIVGQKDFDRFLARIFAADRRGIPKGMIEVIV